MYTILNEGGGRSFPRRSAKFLCTYLHKFQRIVLYIISRHTHKEGHKGDVMLVGGEVKGREVEDKVTGKGGRRWVVT